eukprot:5251149-Prymnesium_polylepis.1
MPGCASCVVTLRRVRYRTRPGQRLQLGRERRQLEAGQVPHRVWRQQLYARLPQRGRQPRAPVRLRARAGAPTGIFLAAPPTARPAPPPPQVYRQAHQEDVAPRARRQDGVHRWRGGREHDHAHVEHAAR